MVTKGCKGLYRQNKFVVRLAILCITWPIARACLAEKRDNRSVKEELESSLTNSFCQPTVWKNVRSVSLVRAFGYSSIKTYRFVDPWTWKSFHYQKISKFYFSEVWFYLSWLIQNYACRLVLRNNFLTSQRIGPEIYIQEEVKLLKKSIWSSSQSWKSSDFPSNASTTWIYDFYQVVHTMSAPCVGKDCHANQCFLRFDRLHETFSCTFLHEFFRRLRWRFCMKKRACMIFLAAFGGDFAWIFRRLRGDLAWISCNTCVKKKTDANVSSTAIYEL